MNDFIKAKLFIAAATLITLIALNPLISRYWDTGHYVLGLRFKAIYFYYATILFSSASIFFYYYQFFSQKDFRKSQTLGNISYTISLSSSIMYIMFFIASYIVEAVKTREGIISLWILFSVLFLCLVGALAVFITRKLASIDKESRKKHYIKEEYSPLQRSRLLFYDGYYDLSVIEVFKAVTNSLKEALLFCGISIKHKNTSTLIDMVREKDFITAGQAVRLHDLRLTRNSLTHGDGTITKNEAWLFLRDSGSIISSLSGLDIYSNKLGSYNWLMLNSARALEALKTASHPALPEVMEHINGAWLNHNKENSRELAVFFEPALIHNTPAMIDWLSGNDVVLSNWVKEIALDMFTDFSGRSKKSLKHSKRSVLTSLNRYIECATDGKKKQLAQHLKSRMEKIPVRKIE